MSKGKGRGGTCVGVSESHLMLRGESSQVGTKGDEKRDEGTMTKL
jgi:hypothetical protein